MHISIVCVGKIKEKFYVGAVDEYKKRLSRYCKLDIIEVPDEKTPDGASEVVEEQIRNKEGERILKSLKDDATVITLEIKGEMLDSEQLASKIDQWGIRGVSHLQFVIGGSLGLSKEVMARSDYRLSFSKMTFPHQLMRVIFHYYASYL